MEAGESSTRQSGHTSSANNPDYYDQRHRESFDTRPYNREPPPAMATATLISPASAYHSHHSTPFSSGFPHPGSSSSIPGMISPTDSRRTSDETESHRQSLPSLSEVISGSKQPSYPSAVPTSMPGPPSLPSPFTSNVPPRPFSDIPPQERHPSPRTLHNASSFPPPRGEPLPPFSDHARSSLSGRPPAPPPPPGPFPGAHPSPPVKMEGRELEHRQGEVHQQNGSYPQPPPQASQIPYPPPSQLPPGQLPLSGYPISPRHGGPSLPSPFDAQRPPLHPNDDQYARRDGKYEQALNRQFEAWSYSEYLAKIASSSRTIYHFAEAYAKIATEDQGAHTIPGRLPTEREVGEMLNNADYLKNMLDSVRNIVQQSIMNERAREGSRGKPPYEEEDVTMYGDGMKQTYDMSGVKKRRGRAAPPGRCHSCNRIDTPEWRRGPDGARTLCNACGLHYAKLERKRQMEQRSFRPKPSDERT